jgi:Cyclin, N-terminal domain
MVNEGSGDISDSNSIFTDGLTVMPEGARCKMETVDYLLMLMRQEDRVYLPPVDYLTTIQWSSATAQSNDNDPVSEIWRRKLCEWCYEVVDHFGFDREVVSIALNYLDRSVSIKASTSISSITRREFQLFAVTSLYMAIKVHGETESSVGPRQKLRIDAFVQLSRGFFQIQTIEAKERSILKDLGWHVNPPTSLKFISVFLQLCPKWNASSRSLSQANVLGAIYDVSRYLTELTVCVSHFSFHFKSSLIGYAAVLCAIEALQRTLPLPQAVQLSFLSNIAELVGLAPDDSEVTAASDMLKDLCPNFFEDDFPSEFFADRMSDFVPDDSVDGRKDSPISVTTQYHSLEVANATRRKRSRSGADNERSAT